MSRNLLKMGERWLADKQRQHASEPVTYSRSDASAAVRAVRGRAQTVTEDDSGLQIPTGDGDWIIEASELVLDGNATEPRSGDRITDASGVIFEVSPPGPGLQEWVYAEPTQLRYRIHTKQIS